MPASAAGAGERSFADVRHKGTLEPTSPSHRHERIAALIDGFVLEWTYARGVPLDRGGATTLRRDDLRIGVEADRSYDVEHSVAASMNGDLDLNVFPPPDLVLEVDVGVAAPTADPRRPGSPGTLNLAAQAADDSWPYIPGDVRGTRGERRFSGLSNGRSSTDLVAAGRNAGLRFARAVTRVRSEWGKVRIRLETT